MTDEFDRAWKLMTLACIVFGALFFGVAALATILGQTGVDMIFRLFDHINWRTVTDWVIAVVVGLLMGWSAAYGWSQ